jgi:cell division protein FtsL
MIGRLFHLAAIGCLVGSAVYAYSTKYGTIYLAEEVSKAKQKVRKEKDGIAVLKAEWQHLNKPDRLQALAQKHLTLQNLEIWQIARFEDAPLRGAKGDAIGAKLEAFGALEPTATPKSEPAAKAATKTPGGKKP